jgi:hypothetical protein
LRLHDFSKFFAISSFRRPETTSHVSYVTIALIPKIPEFRRCKLFSRLRVRMNNF